MKAIKESTPCVEQTAPLHAHERGIALVTTLVIGGIIGIVLMSVMLWAGSHNLVTTRSMAWDSALGVSEAGIEEALAQLKFHYASRTANNWTLSSGAYTKTRTFGDGYYTVTISTDALPVIISKGYVKAPLHVTNYICRTVRVTTTNNSLFYAGLITKQSINMNGNNVTVDSYDPADPTWSTGGQWDINKRHDQGNIAIASGLTNGFSVGNANIWGKIATGPGGTDSVGANGSVGDMAWHTNGNSGVKPGWESHDVVVAFPPIVAPTATVTPPSGKVSGNTYQAILGTGNYLVTDLSGSVYVNGNATLTINNSLKLNSGATIVIAPGASLAMYVSAASASFGGKSIQNLGGSSTNLFYYGLPSNTAVSFNGNTAFSGVIYAPNANISMGGGGNGTPVDVSGGLMGLTLTMGGQFNLHYDESLKRIPTGVQMSTWTEL